MFVKYKKMNLPLPVLTLELRQQTDMKGLTFHPRRVQNFGFQRLNFHPFELLPSSDAGKVNELSLYLICRELITPLVKVSRKKEQFIWDT